MKELIEAYFNEERSVSSYRTTIHNGDVLYTVKIYNGEGCQDSVEYVTNSELLEFMWSRINDSI